MVGGGGKQRKMRLLSSRGNDKKCRQIMALGGRPDESCDRSDRRVTRTLAPPIATTTSRPRHTIGRPDGPECAARERRPPPPRPAAPHGRRRRRRQSYVFSNSPILTRRARLGFDPSGGGGGSVRYTF